MDIRELHGVLKDAIDAIDGAKFANEQAQNAQRKFDRISADIKVVQDNADKQKAQSEMQVAALNKQLSDLQEKLEGERAKHAAMIEYENKRSQEQIANASETLEKLNSEIRLTRQHHDDLMAAIARLKAMAQDAARL